MGEAKRHVNKTFLALALLVVGLIWGLSFLVTGIALEKLDVFQVLAARWGIAALTALVFFVIPGRARLDFSRQKRFMLVLAVLSQPCLYAIFETLGIDSTTASESAIFIAGIPSFVLILGALFFHKKIFPLTTLSIALTLGGIVVCTVFSPGFTTGSHIEGYIVLAAAVIIGAFYDLAGASASEGYSPLEITVSMAVNGGIFFNVLVLVRGSFLSTWKTLFLFPKAGLACVFLGVLCSVLCYFLYNRLLSEVEDTPLVANLTSSSITIVGVLSGILLAGDPFGWYTLIGLVMTVAGIILSSKEA